jgi:hypothetical protein
MRSGDIIGGGRGQGSGAGHRKGGSRNDNASSFLIRKGLFCAVCVGLLVFGTASEASSAARGLEAHLDPPFLEDVLQGNPAIRTVQRNMDGRSSENGFVSRHIFFSALIRDRDLVKVRDQLTDAFSDKLIGLGFSVRGLSRPSPPASATLRYSWARGVGTITFTILPPDGPQDQRGQMSRPEPGSGGTFLPEADSAIILFITEVDLDNPPL